MTLNRLSGTALMTLVALMAVVGCEAGDDPAEEIAPAERPDTADTAPTPGILAPINQSGVRGTATLEGDAASGERVLRLAVEGLDPGTRYTAHVHEGRCVDGGPIRLPLGRVQADQAGTGGTRMRVASDRLPTDADLFVQVHGPDDQPVACANIER